MGLTKLVACCLAAASIVIAFDAGATNPYVEYKDHIKASQNLTALKDNLFGDNVSLYNGATEFTATDIDIPGNSALPVQLVRRLSIEIVPSGPAGDWDSRLLGAGNWDIDVPYISGSYVSTGSGGWPTDRCTVGSMPTATGFSGTDFWHGNTVHIPGSGDRPLLGIETSTPKPSDAFTYKWSTRERDAVSCLTSIKPGAFGGEGYRLRTASGLIYYFDVPVQRYVGYMKRSWGGLSLSFTVNREKDYLLASKIEDRFGNTVTFTYNSNGHPTQIASNDGRTITLTYDATGVYLDHASVNSGSALRTWDYTYGSGATAGMLTSVTLPDTHQWSFAYSGSLYPYAEDWSEDPGANCNLKPPINAATFAIAITHPSGAMGTFGFGNTRHYRSGVHHGECISELQQSEDTWVTVHRLHTPHYFDVMSLYNKTITGPGLANRTWSYDYGITNETLYGTGDQIVYPCTSGCDLEKVVTVTNPDATSAEYHYGMLYAVNEGRLLRSSMLDANGIVKRTQTTTYMTDAQSAGENFFARYGIVLGDDDPSQAAVRPVVSQTTTQDGVTFSMVIAQGCPSTGIFCFDIYANPTKVTKSSTIGLGYSRTEQTTYFNQTAKWVIGQAETVKCVAPTTALPAGCGSSGTMMSETTYDSTYGVPLTTKSFGKPQQTLGYNFTAGTQDGTLKTVTDGRGFTTTLSSWKRGVPQLITYPATADQMTPATMSASVDDNGWITSVVDENGYSTGYGYDDMGRLAAIAYPSDDSTTWNPTTITYEQMTVGAYGIGAGHWRRTESTGDARKVIDYDAMWRPVVENQYDSAETARSITVKRYDLAGQLSFQSYPVGALSGGYTNASLTGTRTYYDALDRVIKVEQDAEDSTILGTLTTYLTGFKTKVTNPRGFDTITSYMAFDQPTMDWPVNIQAADGRPVEQVTDIARDVFGKPTSIKRHDPGNSISETRSYVYDVNQLLCKTIEPETGATLVNYDDANNIDWSASGQPLTTLVCDRSSVAEGDKVKKDYDARNRLKTLTFPDGRGDQEWHWTPDGLPSQVTTYNDPGQQSPFIDSYHYNKRRMLDGTGESLKWPGWYTWSIGHGYDANGHLMIQHYPTGQDVNYAPNALGQPTQAGTYATDVSYWPNGAIKHFVYGNGIVHDMTQNARQLPDTSKDAYGSTKFISDGYDYDANGNVAAISDGATGRVGRGDRTMAYDALDRLMSAASPMFGNGTTDTVYFSHDALDNLTHLTMPATGPSNPMPGRDQFYCYDTNWRLSSLRTADSCGGTSLVDLTYDTQGNLASKGAQAYTFGINNRLYETPGKEQYRYDANGNRGWQSSSAGYILSQYAQDGQLMHRTDTRTGYSIDYISLGGSLVASWKKKLSDSSITVEYQHTDALGTPVAVTDANRNVIERSEYEPYGLLLNRAQHDGPGFTGHVQDATTGLTYMQQRYYDPMIGAMLSVDPVTAYDNGDMRHFNRYAYAYDNPYKFTDPDGRCPQCLWGAPIGAGVNLGVQLLTGKGSFKQRWANVSWKQVGVAAVAGGLSGGVTAIASTAATTTGAVVANVIGNAGVGALATQAGAKVDGRTASTSEVLQGAALSGGTAGLGTAIEAVPGAAARSASAGMSQTERTATGNLLGGIKQATPGFKYSNPAQTAANATGAAVSASPDLKPLTDKRR